MPHSNINSVLYNHLLEESSSYNLDGDRLIAVYSMLKLARKNKESIKKKDLNSVGISRKTLKRYLPALIDLQLVHFSKSGNLLFAGNKKLEDRFRSKSKKYRVKYFLINIESTIAKTALNSYFIRTHGYIDSVNRKIDRTQHLLNLSARGKRVKPFTEYDKVVLSVQGFGLLKTGNTNKLSKGQYWKMKLVKAKYIYSKRQYDFIKDCSKEEFNFTRFNSMDRSLRWEKGKMYKETPSLISTTIPARLENLTEVKVKTAYKKKEYLQFDMINFWQSM